MGTFVMDKTKTKKTTTTTTKKTNKTMNKQTNKKTLLRQLKILFLFRRQVIACVSQCGFSHYNLSPTD